MLKYATTVNNPSMTSPTILAKPMMLISILSLVYLARISSSFFDTSA